MLLNGEQKKNGEENSHKVTRIHKPSNSPKITLNNVLLTSKLGYQLGMIRQ